MWVTNKRLGRRGTQGGIGEPCVWGAWLQTRDDRCWQADEMQVQTAGVGCRGWDLRQPRLFDASAGGRHRDFQHLKPPEGNCSLGSLPCVARGFPTWGQHLDGPFPAHKTGPRRQGGAGGSRVCSRPAGGKDAR